MVISSERGWSTSVELDVLSIDHNDIRINTAPLESHFPPGIFDERAPESAEALQVFRAIDGVIKDTSTETAVLARYSLLQSFPRLNSGNNEEIFEPRFVRSYCEALCPPSYREVLDSLNENEIEVFLKNHLVAHETWGHPEGVCMFAKTMLESCVHQEVPVVVERLSGEEREIPESMQSRLGTRMSTVGKDLAIGSRFVCRSRHCSIAVGMISRSMLAAFQQAGWATGTEGSDKLSKLVALASPFYLEAKVRFIVETTGFELGKALLGESKLGSRDA